MELLHDGARQLYADAALLGLSRVSELAARLRDTDDEALCGELLERIARTIASMGLVAAGPAELEVRSVKLARSFCEVADVRDGADRKCPHWSRVRERGAVTLRHGHISHLLVDVVWSV
jgi:hypothetical protein